MFSSVFTLKLALAIGLVFLAVVVALWRKRNSAPRTCNNCAHFDLEEGQEAIKQTPMFLLAAQHIPMAQMATPIVGHDEHDNPVYGKPAVPAKARWDHVGACMCPAPSARDEDGDPVLKWAGDTCQHFKRVRGGKRQLPVLAESPRARG